MKCSGRPEVSDSVADAKLAKHAGVDRAFAERTEPFARSLAPAEQARTQKTLTPETGESTFGPEVGTGMRRFLIPLVFLLTTGGVWACGDKLMLITGVRLSGLKPARSASILAYSKENSASSTAIRQIQLQPALTKAGHRFQVVEDAARLADALKTGKYDLVIADVAVAGELSQLVQSAPSHPAILPVAFNRTKAEQSAAQKKYHCLLKAPSDPEHYLAAIDQAMEWKAKAPVR